MKANNNSDNEWDDELKDAPNLRKAADQKSFDVPEGYFENLSSTIMDKIAAGEVGEGKVAVIRPLFSVRKLLIPALAVAAIVLAFFIFGKLNQQESKSEVVVNVNSEELYNAELVDNLDEGQLMDALAELTVDTATVKTGEFENYLIESSTDDILINNL